MIINQKLDFSQLKGERSSGSAGREIQILKIGVGEKS